jgi:hypothetical protein
MVIIIELFAIIFCNIYDPKPMGINLEFRVDDDDGGGGGGACDDFPHF